MPSRSPTETPLAPSAEQSLGLDMVPAAQRERARGVGAILQSLELDPVIVRAGMASVLAADGVLEQDRLEAHLGDECARLTRAVLALPGLEAASAQGEEALSAPQAENL